ncbi:MULTISPECIES: hypothetical protein [Acidiphilium]|uniref:Uncharacterized protein n=1 Tax=Acidiphilium rubrum TaxID=526 RepID=A0A8G2CM64_ACIRU|nr:MULTISPECIES: hypothetical protein [Acidiphilium]SIR17675.1 hypothetical protein SAMN05421828_1186 [Acidiphilium rubrum]
MMLPVTAVAAQPIAYAGGQASTAKPGFAAALQATLAQLQATNHGLTANSSANHHHHDTSLFGTSANSGSASSLTMPPL